METNLIAICKLVPLLDGQSSLVTLPAVNQRFRAFKFGRDTISSSQRVWINSRDVVRWNYKLQIVFLKDTWLKLSVKRSSNKYKQILLVQQSCKKIANLHNSIALSIKFVLLVKQHIGMSIWTYKLQKMSLSNWITSPPQKCSDRQTRIDNALKKCLCLSPRYETSQA